MTKAELLRRYRWFPLILPFAAAVGWYVFRYFAIYPFLRLGEPLSPIDHALIYLYQVSDFGLIAWVLLTLACSVWTTHNLRVAAGLLGGNARALAWVIALVIFVSQAAFAAMVFGIF